MTATHHVAGLSFDAARIEERRKTLGASEIGAVAGVSAKRTPLDVFSEKRGIAAPFLGNEYTEWGLRLEEPIAQKYREVMDVASFRKSPTLIRASDPWMSATPDMLVGLSGLPTERGVEIKRFGDHRADEFGAAGTDQVPNEVATQCHWSMMVVELREWDVAVLLGQADFRIFHLRYDDAIANHLYDIGRRFWFEHVVPGVEPAIDGTTASHKYLAQKFKTHSQVLLEPTPEVRELVDALRHYKKEAAAAEFSASGIEAQLKLAIGDAAGIAGLCTWKAPRTGYVSWKDIAHEIANGTVPPEIVARHTNEPTRRFLLTKEK